MRPGVGTGFARSHGKLVLQQGRAPDSQLLISVYPAHPWAPSMAHSTADLRPNSSAWLWALPMQGSFPHLRHRPALCSLHMFHPPFPKKARPTLVGSNIWLGKKVIVPGGKLPQWHRWKQILPSNSFSIYEYTFVIKILREQGDLVSQFACTLYCGEKLNFQLFKSWLLLTFHN